MSVPHVYETFGEFQIIAYRPEYHDGAMNVVQCGYFDAEPVCLACEMDSPDAKLAQTDIENLIKDVAKDGVSLLARHTPTNLIVGATFNKIEKIKSNNSAHSYLEQFIEGQCKSENARALLKFMNTMDSKFDVAAEYNVDTVLKIVIHATHSDYIRRAVGRKLMEHTIEIARKLKNDTDAIHKPQLVTAIWTSVYPRKIGDALAFHHLAEALFAEFRFNGKSFADRIDKTHRSAVLAVKTNL